MGVAMEPALFSRFCALAHDRAGICLKPGKEELVKARVAKRQRALGLNNVADYLQYLEADPTGEEMVQFLDVISTNFTSFFREPDHLEELAQTVKQWKQKGGKKLRLWSAASSSGEEGYSMAITVMEALGGEDVDWRILGTDISTNVLAVAQQGVYPASRLETLPRGLLGKYFKPVTGDFAADEPHYQVNQELRSRVSFARMNLSRPPFPMRGPMDVVFCRNVFIYFDQDVRQKVVSEVERLIAPGGLFCIGHTETLTGVRYSLKLVRPSVFRMPGAGP